MDREIETEREEVGESAKLSMLAFVVRLRVAYAKRTIATNMVPSIGCAVFLQKEQENKVAFLSYF